MGGSVWSGFAVEKPYHADRDDDASTLIDRMNAFTHHPAGGGTRRHHLSTFMKQTDFTLILRSDLEELTTLHRFMDRVFQETEADPDVRARSELAMDEAVSNAIRHGNAQDPSKEVRIRMVKRGGGLECRVEDEGPGFDATGIPDPTEEPMLLRTHGRGVFLIRQLADELRFEEGGRAVEMLFVPRSPA